MYEYESYAYEEPAVWPYYLIGGIVIFIISCLMANTFHSLWKSVSADLRTLSPEQSWLIIIPILGVIWMFIVIRKLGEALKEEFKRRNIVEFESTPGLGIGWAFSFALLTAQLVAFIDEPLICGILFVAATTLMIIFWIRMAGFLNKLSYDPGTGFHQHPHVEQSPPVYYHDQQQPPYYPPTQDYSQQPPYNPRQQNQQQNDWDRWRPKE